LNNERVQVTVEVVKPQAKSEYAYLGGHETVGKRGGYLNYQVHFPKLWADQGVQRWLRKRAPGTRAEYLLRFEKFLSWAKPQLKVEGPNDFLEWARSQPDGTVVQDVIDEYAETLSKSQAHVATALLRSFLGRNGYRELPKIDWEPTMSFTEGYKRADIQALLSYLDDSRHKLYVVMGKDSGLRANDLLFLRYRHIKEDLEKGEKFVHIRFEKERYLRRKAPGRTFIGPNSVNLLRQLVDSGVVKKGLDDRIIPWNYRTIAKILFLAKRKASLNMEIQPSHGLRKFFENCLDKTGMDHNKKLQLEGHSQGVRNAYTSREVEELRTLYGEAYRFLDLSEESVVSNEVGALQAKITEQEKTIKGLKEDLSKQKELEGFVRELMANPEIRRIMGKKDVSP